MIFNLGFLHIINKFCSTNILINLIEVPKYTNGAIKLIIKLFLVVIKFPN